MSHIHPFPHHYAVDATCTPSSEVVLGSNGLEDLATMPPPEFGGPGDRWSPETLLVGALSSCFALTFRAIARHVGFEWTELRCHVEGLLERERGKSRFTKLQIHAQLTAPAGHSNEVALDVLRKAKDGCLISNSLSATVELKVTVSAAGG